MDSKETSLKTARVSLDKEVKKNTELTKQMKELQESLETQSKSRKLLLNELLEKKEEIESLKKSVKSVKETSRAELDLMASAFSDVSSRLHRKIHEQKCRAPARSWLAKHRYQLR